MAKPPPSPLYIMKGGMSSVHCLKYDTNNELLYAGTQNGMIYIWDLQLNRVTKVLKHSEETCISVHNNSDILVSQDKLCSVKCWHKTECDFILKHNIETPPHVTFCKMDMHTYGDDNLLITPNSNSEIRLYSLTNNQLVSCLKSTTHDAKLGEIMAIKSFNLNGISYILSTYESGVLLLWDLRNSKYFTSELNLTIETPMAIDFTVSNSVGYCGCNDSNVYVFKLTPSLNLIKSHEIALTKPGTSSLKIRPDNKILASGSWDGKLRIFSHKTPKLLAVLDCHDDSILDICFSESPVYSWNCKYLLAAGGADKKISLWEIYDNLSQM